MKRPPLMIAAAALITASSLASAADQPGSFPGVVIGAKIIGGDQYEPLYTRIGEWEKLTGAKVNILTKKNGFDIDKELKSDIAANSVNWCVGWNHTSFLRNIRVSTPTCRSWSRRRRSINTSQGSSRAPRSTASFTCCRARSSTSPRSTISRATTRTTPRRRLSRTNTVTILPHPRLGNR